ncbi:S-layer homology domain-containing protein [Paenibacillus cremeus]|uniref:Uncharacterized protein n=1 Tax=Paenibacillus cremeus TaxID=2163881 RepID=A0A559K4N1_9BACL|nr:S-layer homology domain-containing protein [Paenibacillus cremeus]TVY07105.1 hypothetical protein FPZ49_25885 [Paenibacillus cremeus]
MKRRSNALIHSLLSLFLIFSLLPMGQAAAAVPLTDDFSTYTLSSFPGGSSAYWSVNSSTAAANKIWKVQSVGGDQALANTDTTTTSYQLYNEALNYYDGSVSVAFQLTDPKTTKAGFVLRNVDNGDRYLADVTVNSSSSPTKTRLEIKKYNNGNGSTSVSIGSADYTGFITANHWYVIEVTIDSANQKITTNLYDANQTTHAKTGSNIVNTVSSTGAGTGISQFDNTFMLKAAKLGLYAVGNVLFDDFTVPSTFASAPALSITSASTSAVALSWSQTNGSTTYTVKKSSDPAGVWNIVNPTSVPSLSGTSTVGFQSTTVGVTCSNNICTYTDTGSFSSGNTYYYAVADNNQNAYFVFKSVSYGPGGLKGISDNGQVALSWNAVTNATSYNVYRSDTSGGNFTQIASNLSSPSYLDTGLTNGTPYYYTVTWSNAAIGESLKSSEATATPNMLQPPVVGASSGNQKVGLFWNTVAGATYYVVNRSLDNGITYQPLATIPVAVTESTYLDTGLTNGTTYKYNVVASDGSISSSSNTVRIIPQPLTAPASVTAAPGNTTANLTWSTVTGATYYNLKRSTTAGGSYTTVGTVTPSASVSSVTYTDTLLTNGITYYYIVTAGNRVEESTNSAEVNVKPFTALPAPTGLKATASLAQVSLVWDSVAGATGYNVLRSTTPQSGYAPLATVTGTTYMDISVQYGTTYYYTVQSVINSVPSDTYLQTETSAAVPKLTLTATNSIADGSVSLSWPAVTGAASYNIKRGGTTGGPYTKIGTVTSTVYTDLTPVLSVANYYVISPVVNGVEGANSSEASIVPQKQSTPSGGGGSSNGGSSSSDQGIAYVNRDKNGNVSLDVQETSDKDGDKTLTKVSVNTDSFLRGIDAVKDADAGKQKIRIQVEGKEPISILELPADGIVKAQQSASGTVLSIKANGTTYDLPIKAIDAAALAKSLGVDPRDVTIVVRIETVSGKLSQDVNDTASRGGMKLLGSIVDYSLVARAGKNEKEISDFKGIYVPRTITLSATADGSTTTAVRYDAKTGKFMFVPATFKQSSGKTEVTMKRPGNSIYTVIQNKRTFDDLSGHWAKADVELLTSKLVVDGASETTFAPNQSVTRAEFASMLVRALGLNTVKEGSFKDVAATDWFAEAVNTAAKASLVTGFENNTFRPNDTITREQIAVMIARAAEFAGKKPKEGKDSADKFKDSTTVSSWAKASVSAAVDAKIVNGTTDNTFAPAANATRAEATVMLKRLLQYVQFIN